MTDLHTRFQSLDALPAAPDLWSEVEQRAMATQPTRRSSAWVLIAVTLLLMLVIGGAVLVGSGIVKLPITVDASGSPSSTAHESAAAPSSPVIPVPASWTAAGAMIEVRTNHTATQLLDGRVLVTGGYTSDSSGLATILASAELYDPSTRQWTATGGMLGIRAGHTATLLPDGKVLVAGGSACSDYDGCPLASAELYDPGTGSWTATGSMIVAGTGRTATLLGTGKVLVVGGAASIVIDPLPLASAELYDPSTGSWTAAAEMADARSGPTATLLLGGKVLVAGGSGGTGLLSTVELYDPRSDSWTATGAMLEHNIGHTATLLLDGRVLVAGGGVGTSAEASAELYDPRTGQWTATGAMLEGRIYHKATLLPGGKVLVAGGANGVVDPMPSASAQLYDPSTGSWTATESMAEARSGSTATLMPGGTVLVVGGAGSNFGLLASAELYDPGSGT
jgi:N-acetylneuraminic acid mutarotase